MLESTHNMLLTVKKIQNSYLSLYIHINNINQIIVTFNYTLPEHFTLL